MKKEIHGYTIAVDYARNVWHEKVDGTTATVVAYAPNGDQVLDGYWDTDKEYWEWHWLSECYGICDDPETSKLAAEYTAVDPEWRELSAFLDSEEVVAFAKENTFKSICPECGKKCQYMVKSKCEECKKNGESDEVRC